MRDTCADCDAKAQQMIAAPKPAISSSPAAPGPATAPTTAGPAMRPRPGLPATKLLIAINVLVFVAMVASGVSASDPTSPQLIHWGADYGPLTLTTQPWRAITSMFVHIGIIHIALNMWCLWSLCLLAEPLFGSVELVIIYLLTGVGGSVLSLLWAPMRASAGASGAVFGIAGAMIGVLYFGRIGSDSARRSTLKNLGWFAAYNLLFGLRAHVNNMAHVGGFVTGIALGAALARVVRKPRPERAEAQRWFFAIAAILLLVAFAGVRQEKGPAVVHENAAIEAAEKGDCTAAMAELNRVEPSKHSDIGNKVAQWCAQQQGATDQNGPKSR
jgi:rhomboid protease GluP